MSSHSRHDVQPKRLCGSMSMTLPRNDVSMIDKALSSLVPSQTSDVIQQIKAMLQIQQKQHARLVRAKQAAHYQEQLMQILSRTPHMQFIHVRRNLVKKSSPHTIAQGYDTVCIIKIESYYCIGYATQSPTQQNNRHEGNLVAFKRALRAFNKGNQKHQNPASYLANLHLQDDVIKRIPHGWVHQKDLPAFDGEDLSLRQSSYNTRIDLMLPITAKILKTFQAELPLPMHHYLAKDQLLTARQPGNIIQLQILDSACHHYNVSTVQELMNIIDGKEELDDNHSPIMQALDRWTITFGLDNAGKMAQSRKEDVLYCKEVDSERYFVVHIKELC